MTHQDVDRLLALRADLFAALKDALEADGHCKHYEGTFLIRLPNYFEQEDEEPWQVTLDCYKIGPARHYEWSGWTLSDAITKAESEIRAWIADDRAEAG
jgi:hypothetical protein